MSTSRSTRTVVTTATCDSSSIVPTTTTKEYVKQKKETRKFKKQQDQVSFWKRIRQFRQPTQYHHDHTGGTGSGGGAPKSIAATEKLLLVVNEPPLLSSSFALRVQQLEMDLSRERELRLDADQRAERLEKQFHYYQQELSASQQDIEHYMLLYEEVKETLELHKFYYTPHMSNLDFTLLQKTVYTDHETDEQVGAYELYSVLGNGTHGTVLKAFDTDNKEHVAVKRIPKNNFVARVDLAQLEYEITILREAASAADKDMDTGRNIVPLVDFVEGINSYYMIMPLAWMDAYSLRKRLFLFQGCACHRQTVQIVMQGVFNALEFLHTHMATAHMDVKPENILIMGQEIRSLPSEGAWISLSQVRLTDFGFALPLSASKRKALDEKAARLSTKMLLRSQESICRGTRGFYAPELLSENHEDDLDLSAVDMWAAGCTLMDLMMGLPDRWMECYHRIGDHVADGTMDDHVYHKMEMRFESILIGLRRQMKCKPDLLDFLLGGLIVMDPNRRLSATEAMDTDWMVHTVHTTTDACGDDTQQSDELEEDDSGSPRASF